MLISLSVAPTTVNGDYLASFYSSSGSGGGFETRIFASTTATGWTFGLNPSGTAPVDWGTDLSLNTYYNIVLKFDVGTKAVSMGVFAANGSPTSDADLTLTGTSTSTAGPDFFALRQGSGTVMLENIDSIVTGTTLADVTAAPEPSTIALAGLGGVAALLAIRRRR
jgi:MYXO-CTERM domain-containing protein